jgi:hypothetical protein
VEEALYARALAASKFEDHGPSKLRQGRMAGVVTYQATTVFRRGQSLIQQLIISVPESTEPGRPLLFAHERFSEQSGGNQHESG